MARVRLVLKPPVPEGYGFECDSKDARWLLSTRGLKTVREQAGARAGGILG